MIICIFYTAFFGSLTVLELWSSELIRLFSTCKFSTWLLNYFKYTGKLINAVSAQER